MWAAGTCKHEYTRYGISLAPLFPGGSRRKLWPAAVYCVGMAAPGIGYCEYVVANDRRYFDHFAVTVWTRDGVVRVMRAHVTEETSSVLDMVKVAARGLSFAEFEDLAADYTWEKAREQQRYCKTV